MDPRELEIEGREFGSKKYRLRFGYFRPMMIGGVTNHIYGESFLSFEEKETGKTFNITVDERFVLYSLQGKCTEYFDDESLNKCKIDLPAPIKCFFFRGVHCWLVSCELCAFDDIEGERRSTARQTASQQLRAAIQGPYR